MVTKKRDSQRSALYKWESALWRPLALREEVGVEDAQALCTDVWGAYFPGVSSPEVRQWRGGGAQFLPRVDGVIDVPRRVRTEVVLHEVAHAIVWMSTWCAEGEEVKDACLETSSHGPVFASVLVDLLDWWGGYDPKLTKKLGREQRPRRVKFAPKRLTPQRKKKVRRRA